MPDARMLLEDLESQWFNLSGGAIPISSQALVQMAYAGVTTLSEFGQFMSNVILKQPDMSTYAPIMQIHPGLSYGIDDDQFQQRRQEYSDTYYEQTGQLPDQAALNQAFLKPGLSSAQYGKELQADQNMQKTYAWLKFGLSHTDFMHEKEMMRNVFGSHMSDEEALQHYRQQHEQSAGGGSASLRPQPVSKEPPLSRGSSMAR